MKGLLLQDLYIMKKNLILCAGLCLYFLVILLIGSNTSDSSLEIDMVMYTFCGLIPCFFTSCAYFTIQPGKTSKTALFIHSCPLSSTSITMEKYVLIYALFLCSYIVIFSFALINHLICGYVLKKNTVFLCFIIASVILFFINLELPISMRFGQAAAAAFLILFICLIIIGGLTIIVKATISPDLYKIFSAMSKRRVWLLIILLVTDTLSAILSFQTAKRINHC